VMAMRSPLNGFCWPTVRDRKVLLLRETTRSNAPDSSIELPGEAGEQGRGGAGERLGFSPFAFFFRSKVLEDLAEER
jgi:hypothetical protein